MNFLETIYSLFNDFSRKLIPQKVPMMIGDDSVETPLESYVDEVKKREKKIISDSQSAIKDLKSLVDLVKGTKYEDKFSLILEKTSKIHDKIISDDRIDISRLDYFTKYKTIEFYQTFSKLLEPLMEKEVDETLLSTYKIEKEVDETEHYTKQYVISEEKNINILYKNLLENVGKDLSKSKLNIFKINLSLLLIHFIQEECLYKLLPEKEITLQNANIIDDFISSQISDFDFCDIDIKLHRHSLYLGKYNDEDYYQSMVMFDPSTRKIFTINRNKIMNSIDIDLGILNEFFDYLIK